MVMHNDMPENAGDVFRAAALGCLAGFLAACACGLGIYVIYLAARAWLHF